ncbi:MAG: DUF5710 domain-containing protein [Sedimenticola sp.]|nr:DUF5710 domain-containing protein [Sedimenticola sp.]
MPEITFLEVPFNEKSEAKSRGAKWHAEKRKWFIPEDADKTKFEKWIPEYESEFTLRAIAPFYLIVATEICYKCSNPSKVITFGAAGCEGEDENESVPVKFEYIAVLPYRLKNFVETNYPKYYLDWSNTTESFYYINHCEHCGTVLGDFFMHHEPDGAFFPQSPEDVKEMEVIELKGDGFVKLNAEPSWGIMGFIMECATVEKYQP